MKKSHILFKKACPNIFFVQIYKLSPFFLVLSLIPSLPSEWLIFKSVYTSLDCKLHKRMGAYSLCQSYSLCYASSLRRRCSTNIYRKAGRRHEEKKGRNKGYKLSKTPTEVVQRNLAKLISKLELRHKKTFNRTYRILMGNYCLYHIRKRKNTNVLKRTLDWK